MRSGVQQWEDNYVNTAWQRQQLGRHYYLQKIRQRMKGTRGTKFSVCLMLSHVIIIMRYQFDRRVEENVINACVLSSKTEERGRRMNSTPWWMLINKISYILFEISSQKCKLELDKFLILKCVYFQFCCSYQDQSVRTLWQREILLSGNRDPVHD